MSFDETSANLHRALQGQAWIDQGRPDTCIMASYDPATKSIGIGIALKRNAITASIAMAQLSATEVTILIDQLRGLVDEAILATFRDLGHDDD